MPQTARYTLTTTPVQVDLADDDNIAFRSLTIFAQAAGTVVLCEDAASAATGARWPVTAGSALAIDKISDGEDIWIACESGTLDVDVYEMGVA